MEFITEFAAVPAIVVLCMLIAQVLKLWTPLDNSHLPAVCGLLGLLFGVGCYYLVPGYIPAENVIIAAAIGAVSGWAATGIHQTYKQESEK